MVRSDRAGPAPPTAGDGPVARAASGGTVLAAPPARHRRSPTNEPVPVVEQRRATTLDRSPDLVGVHPVVVVPEHSHHAVAPAEARQDPLEAIHVAACVADEIAAQHHEIGVELPHRVGHAPEPPRGDSGTMVQIGDQRQAVAHEPRGKALDGDRDFGCLEPGAIPADERTRQPLGQPSERSLGDALEPRRAPLPRGRVTAGGGGKTPPPPPRGAPPPGPERTPPGTASSVLPPLFFLFPPPPRLLPR